MNRKRPFGGHRGHQGKTKKKIYQSKKKSWQIIDEETAELRARYATMTPAKIEKFTDIPLCKRTQQGLENGKYTIPTEIQREAIVLGLQGHDILGAAKTGSGKTLAFLIPLLETLYQEKWTTLDGIGALIISPTRELAFQTFSTLRKIGKFHDFSAGVVTGGKHTNLKEESGRMGRTNIVVCTPGRLLQHMNESRSFNAESLKALVLDEADQILEEGFAKEMNAILDNLPTERQTLLFSATQTKDVKDLARLSLKDPMYVSVHEHAKFSTPAKLEQSYIVCDHHDKLNVLWSFIKNHLKRKILIFMSTCKQVRYVFEVMKKLRPGVPVMALYGKMNQFKRMEVFNKFCHKQNAVLFATDVASRGLDFPAVHWVVQLDCPDDSTKYIHRVGRTARFEKDGEALLILLPSEETAMVEELTKRKIPITKIKINPKKQYNIQPKLASMCVADMDLKGHAQKAFVSYLRDTYLKPNKAIFDYSKIDADKFARSLGLEVTPRVRSITRREKLQTKQKTGWPVSTSTSRHDSGDQSESEQSDSSDSGVEAKPVARQQTGKEFKRHITECEKAESDSNEDDSSDDASDDSEEESQSDESETEDSSHCDILRSPAESKRMSRLTPGKLAEVKSKGELRQSGKQANKTQKTSMSFDLGDDDDDDDDNGLYTVKRFDHELDAGDQNDSDSMMDELEQKRKKMITRYSEAKKILKQKIPVNTKIKFDDEDFEGPPKKIMDTEKDSDSDETESYSIADAKLKMQREDKLDKMRQREQIRQKHREKRMKLKEIRRAKIADAQGKNDEMEATLGADEDDISETGEKNSDSNEEDSSGEESHEDVNNDDSSVEEDSDDDSPPTKTRRTLADDEALAMRLLQGESL